MENKMKEWYCYICGKLVKSSYHLVSLSETTDRVFLICDKDSCIEQIEHGYLITKVKELK
jgi:hypothetical protein